MKNYFAYRCVLTSVSVWLVIAGSSLAAVEFARLPQGGVQPQIAIQPDGTVHLVWLAGDPRAADVMYRLIDRREGSSSAPIRVNSQPGSAIAIGTVRGAQLACGRKGQIHVVWNGSASALPKAAKGVPLLYARTTEGGMSFTEQQNLAGRTGDLDGGATVAADADGRVFVLWHGHLPEAAVGEMGRSVFLALSQNDGRTFAPERSIGDTSGACGCCGMSAGVASDGRIYALYRSARGGLHRELSLITSQDHGASFGVSALQDWETPNCPMTTSRVVAGSADEVLTWETRGEIYAQWLPHRGEPARPVKTVSTKKGSKHPSAAVNGRGETCITWTEGTGWQRGGKLSWQVFDAVGTPMSDAGTMTGIEPWNFAACYAKPDGTFVVVY